MNNRKVITMNVGEISTSSYDLDVSALEVIPLGESEKHCTQIILNRMLPCSRHTYYEFTRYYNHQGR